MDGNGCAVLDSQKMTMGGLQILFRFVAFLFEMALFSADLIRLLSAPLDRSSHIYSSTAA